MPYNVVFIQEFIATHFSDDELHTFCQMHFQEVVPDFAPEMSIRKKAQLLVGYCKRRREIETLLQRLEAERPKPYEEHKAKLEQGHAGSSLNEKFLAGAGEYEEMLATAETPQLLHNPSLEGPPPATDHPLTRNAEEVKKWFLKELTVDEQVFVVTAALFPMLERGELMEIYREMLGLLRKPQARSGAEV